MTRLQLHNSLSGKKEDFQPLDPAHVRLYACGPTVYSYAHIGNARMAVVFDLLVRLLRRHYPKVTYVSNITDVDDKIIAASADTGEAISVLTRTFERIYNADMAALGCAPPDIQPRATEHIAEMIALIETLVSRGHAYVAAAGGNGDSSGGGTVLFSVPSFPAYGALSHRSRDDQIAGARVEVAPYKKDPADFVLWKPSAEGQPGWDSPWGFGRPGWHIECSAMAETYLAPLPFDIHGGGADLKFPHHENEIAQSCCAHGAEHDPAAFAQMWVHNGFVTVEGEKMSKSVGNIRLAHHLLEEYDGEVLRFALLSAHYRQPLDWSEDLLTRTKNQLDGLYRTLDFQSDVEEQDSDISDFEEALFDDLNTPKALSVLYRYAHGDDEIGRNSEMSPALLKSKLRKAGNLLGILHKDPKKWLGSDHSDDPEAANIDVLLTERQLARKEKDFTRADDIRKALEKRGILIEDTPAGAQWRRA